jgi:hypothetical protein
VSSEYTDLSFSVILHHEISTYNIPNSSFKSTLQQP